MKSCPDCHSKVGSVAKHRAICLVRNNKGLKTWLESIEFWLRRMEGHLAQAYKNIARYTHVGKRTEDRKQATEEYESAAGMLDRVPKLLKQISGYQCERVYEAQLRSSIVSNQVQEIGVILRNL